MDKLVYEAHLLRSDGSVCAVEVLECDSEAEARERATLYAQAMGFARPALPSPVHQTRGRQLGRRRSALRDPPQLTIRTAHGSGKIE